MAKKRNNSKKIIEQLTSFLSKRGHNDLNGKSKLELFNMSLNEAETFGDTTTVNPEEEKTKEELINSIETNITSSKDKINKLKLDRKTKEENLRVKNQLRGKLDTSDPTSDSSIQKAGIDKEIPLLRKQIKTYDDEIKNTEEGIKSYEEQLKNFKQTTLENIMAKKIIKLKDLNNLVEDRNKIQLSESEIISILGLNDNPRISKESLIEHIGSILMTEANMDDSLRRKIESGEHEYSEHLESDIVKNLSQKAFNEIKEKLIEKTGRRNITMDEVQMFMYEALMNATEKESRFKDQLEVLAVEQIKDYFKVPDNVQFDAKITGMTPVRKGNVQYVKGNKQKPVNKSDEELKPEITKRRLINAMMHGAARKNQNLHFMSDKVRDLDPSLTNDYANLMAANDYNYWGISDEMIAQQARQGVHAGNSRIDLSDPQNPKIIAQGMTFPILLHELTKGVLELISLWGLNSEKDVRDYVLDQSDYLDAEPMDIRIGPEIWSKLYENLDGDEIEYIAQIFQEIVTLPAVEFNTFVSSLLKDDRDAISKLKTIVDQVMSDVKDEDYNEAVGGDDTEYDGQGDDEDDQLDGDEEISLDEPEDTKPIDYSKLSERELNNLIDDAIDNGDFGLVDKLSKFLK